MLGLSIYSIIPSLLDDREEDKERREIEFQFKFVMKFDLSSFSSRIVEKVATIILATKKNNRKKINNLKTLPVPSMLAR